MQEIDKEMRFLLYHDAEDDFSVNAAVLNESIWVTQKTMAELFDCSAERSCMVTTGLSCIVSIHTIPSGASMAKKCSGCEL